MHCCQSRQPAHLSRPLRCDAAAQPKTGPPAVASTLPPSFSPKTQVTLPSQIKTSPESIKHSKVATLGCLTVCELDCIQMFSQPILTDGRSELCWDTTVVELVYVSVAQEKMTPHTHTQTKTVVSGSGFHHS